MPLIAEHAGYRRRRSRAGVRLQGITCVEVDGTRLDRSRCAARARTGVQEPTVRSRDAACRRRSPGVGGAARIGASQAADAARVRVATASEVVATASEVVATASEVAAAGRVTRAACAEVAQTACIAATSSERDTETEAEGSPHDRGTVGPSSSSLNV